MPELPGTISFFTGNTDVAHPLDTLRGNLHRAASSADALSELAVS